MRYFGLLAGLWMAWSAGAAHAQAFDAMAVISSTLGVNANRVCVGEGTRGDLGCPTYAPFISSGGLVGLGTTAPSSSIHIVAQAPNIRLSGTGNGFADYAQVLLGNTDDVAPFTAGMWRNSSGQNGYAGTNSFNVGASANVSVGIIANNAVQVMIGNTGQIGVGTVTPTTGLHVNGTLRIANGGETCDANRAGAIRWNGTEFQTCFGSGGWATLANSIVSGTMANQVAVSAHLNGNNQAITPNSWERINFSHEIYDTNNNFASSRFTPTVPGKYLVIVSTYCNPTGSRCDIILRKNGVNQVYGYDAHSNGMPKAIGIIDMNGTTDYIEGFANTDGSTLQGNVAYTYFQASLINARGADGSGGATTTLSGLTDVTLSGPANGQGLIYSSGNWTNGYPTAISNGTTMVGANSNGYISLTTGGTTTGYFDTVGRLVVPGISVTTLHGISSTNGYMSSYLSIGGTNRRAALDVNGGIYVSITTGSELYLGRGVTGDGIAQGPNIRLDGSTSNHANLIQNSNGALAFWNYGSGSWSERMRIASNGNVGVGTSTPDYPLTVAGQIYSTSGLGIISPTSYYGWGAITRANLPSGDLDADRAGASNLTSYRISHHTGLSLSAHSSYGGIRFYNQGYNAGDTEATFKSAQGARMVMAITNNSVGILTVTPTEALTVNGYIAGGFGVASTVGVANWNDVTNARSGNGRTLLYDSATNGFGAGGLYYYPFSFEYNTKDGSGNLTQFAIPYGSPDLSSHNIYLRSRYSGTWGSWRQIAMTAPSDYRLKQDIHPLAHALEKVMAMKPVVYRMKKGDTSEQDGFLAHEIQQLAPYSVSGKKDATDDEGNPIFQNMDYGRITPLLAGAIQELKAENDELRRRLEALEAKVK